MGTQTNGAVHTHEISREESEAIAHACWADIQAVCARHGCVLSAALQLAEDGTIHPVLQVTTQAAQEHAHDHS